MYLEAIEANYSHEQMNPLNCILQSSKMIRQRLEKLIRDYNILLYEHKAREPLEQSLSSAHNAKRSDFEDENY